MRKINTMLLAAVLAAAVCACGQNGKGAQAASGAAETLKPETPQADTMSAETAAETESAGTERRTEAAGTETAEAGTVQEAKIPEIRKEEPAAAPPVFGETGETRFTALVRGNDGFEAVYSTGRESMITCGGKDGVFWFFETFEDGTSEEYIATLGENGWKCRRLGRAESGGEPEECGDTEAISRIADCVYRGQDGLVPETAEPEERTVSGYDCRRYELPSGPLDILDEFEVTASYRDPADRGNDLLLEYYIAGDEVEAAAF